MRTSLEEGIKLHRFAGIFPEQFSTEAGRHREAVVAADQRMVIRCFRDDLAHVVHDVSHVPPPIQPTVLLDAPFCRRHEDRDRQFGAPSHFEGKSAAWTILAGLDVSVKETSICIMTNKAMRQEPRSR